jgi:hypothetical protein
LYQGLADGDEFPFHASTEQGIGLIVRERLAACELFQELARDQYIV